MYCQFHNLSLSPRACNINFTINSLGHALSISQSVPISKGIHYQFLYQFPRTCTDNSQSVPISKGMHYQFHSPYLQGHALSISQSVSISKGMLCQFHCQFPRTCTVNFTVPISKSMDYQFHHQCPKTCTVSYTISPYLLGHALSISLSISSIGHALSISQSVPISKGMHYQFHYQFPRTCTVIFTISPDLQGHALSISPSIP